MAQQILQKCSYNCIVKLPFSGQTWELTLYSRDNQKTNPTQILAHDRPRVMKICMQSSVATRIRLQPFEKNRQMGGFGVVIFSMGPLAANIIKWNFGSY